MKLKIVYLAFIFSGISFGQNQTMIPYVKNSKWGFSDIDKKILIAPQYDSVSFFKKTIVNQKTISYAFAFLNKRIGIIDPQNKSLIPLSYLDLEKISDSDFFIAKNEQNKFGLISLASVVLPFEYDVIKSVRNNSFLVKKNNKIGIVDFQAKIVIPVIYDQINFIDDDEKNCRWRVANEKVTQYVFTPITQNPSYSTAFSSIESNIPSDYKESKLNEKLDEFDMKIPIKYEYNLFLTKKDNLYGFLNGETNVGFSPKFEKLKFLTSFFDRNNKANYFLSFEEEDKKGLTDQTGSVLLPAKFDEIRSRNNLFIETVLDEKKGIYFISTNRIIETKLDSIKDYEELSEDFLVVLVSENNKNYYVGENGIAFID